MIRLSASSLWRGEKCPPSAVLPAAAMIHEDAQEGQAEHAQLEQKVPEGWAAEVAYAYDPETGAARELGRGLERDYSGATANEVCGTTDLRRVEPTLVRIRDYKTGFGYMVARPKENLQLLHNAASAAAVEGKDLAVIEIEHTATGEVEAARLDAFDLTLARIRIRSILRAVRSAEEQLAAGKELRVVEGDHCWRCEAYAHCPAKLGLALAVSDGKLIKDLPTVELTPAAVARGWPILKEAKKLLGEVERIYRGFAAERRIHLGGRTYLGLVQNSPTEKLDGAVTLEVVKKLHGEKVAAAAVEMKTSKAAVERAVGPLAPPRGKTKFIAETLEAIDLAGGITRLPKPPTVEEFEDKSK